MKEINRQRAKRYVAHFQEKLRILITRHPDKQCDIAARAGISEEAFSFFMNSHSELCQLNMLAVLFAAHIELNEFCSLTAEEKAKLDG